jgi:hypothetical protein
VLPRRSVREHLGAYTDLSVSDRDCQQLSPDRARPLGPELAAPLDVWSPSQLARCAGGGTGWRLPGDVAVLQCCTVPRPASRLASMEERARWLGRVWLPYFLAGVVWVAIGTFVLGNPNGLGLIFVGMVCLALGIYGVGWRLSHGYGLVRRLR